MFSGSSREKDGGPTETKKAAAVHADAERGNADLSQNPWQASVRGDHPWNIVLFIMESAGTRYVFDGRNGRPMPMPFLHEVAEKGWHWKNRYQIHWQR